MVETEAPCESWIGRTKALYDSIQGPNATTLARRCRILLDGVRANGFDDAFVERVARTLQTPASASGRHRARHPKDGVSRGLRTLWKHEQHLLESRARPWLYDRKYTNYRKTQVKAQPRGQGRETKKAIRAERKLWEPHELEQGDKDILEKSGAGRNDFRMPLYATNKQQWDTDIKHDTRKNERAQE